MAEQEITFDQKMHHYMGIEMNIQTWNLLDKQDRTPQDDTRMVFFAHASLYHWLLSPEFKPVNEQRGEWLISRVYAVLGKGELALEHAEKCLALTEEHGFVDFDRAYAYEAMARAYAALGNKEQAKKYYDLAVQAGKEIKNEEDKKYFASDLSNPPWFDMIER